ncbi:MAG: 50S ribosomal protein L29 [Patescibacteria group bacterium]
MKIAELKTKSTAELQSFLRECRAKERDLHFKIAVKQAKDVREIRDLKKTIAKIMTLLNTPEHKQTHLPKT